MKMELGRRKFTKRAVHHSFARIRNDTAKGMGAS